MLKPDKNNKIIHYHKKQSVYCFSDESITTISEKIDKLLEPLYQEGYERRTVVDCIDMDNSIDSMHGTLSANAPNLSVDSTIHVVIVVHDEVWQKIGNDEYPDYAIGDVEEIYYKGA